MSIFKLEPGEDIKGYLYQLNEQLRYMFGNMTPEDNFSKEALSKYLENDEKLAELSFGLNGLQVTVKNFKEDTESRLKVTEEEISLRVKKGEVSSEISVESGQITLSGNRLIVDSTNFKLDAAGNATFSGKVTGATITGSSIRCKGGEFEADEDTVYVGGFYTFDTRFGKYLATLNQRAGMGTNEDVHFWTGWDGSNAELTGPVAILAHYGTLTSRSKMYAQEMYLNHSIFQGSSKYWGLAETIDDIYDRLDWLDANI